MFIEMLRICFILHIFLKRKIGLAAQSVKETWDSLLDSVKKKCNECNWNSYFSLESKFFLRRVWNFAYTREKGDAHGPSYVSWRSSWLGS